MSDGLLALFIALVVGIGLFVLAVIWNTDDEPEQPEQVITPRCLLCGDDWKIPQRWPQDDD